MPEEKNEALKFAMKLIGLRKRSVFEITKRLKKKDYEENIINEVLNELNKYGYLDDEKFTEAYINDRINFSPRGSFLIKKELKEKGLAENIISEKIEELLPEEKEIELAQSLADKKLRMLKKNIGKEKIRQKIGSHLQSRGYSSYIIYRVLENIPLENCLTNHKSTD
jgi:regulatory protein